MKELTQQNRPQLERSEQLRPAGRPDAPDTPTQCLCSEENFKNQESASQGFNHAAEANQLKKKGKITITKELL